MGRPVNFLPMAPLTALAFLLMASALFVHVRALPHRYSSAYSAGATLVVLLLCVLRILEFSTRLHFGFEEFLVRSPMKFGGVPRGRISPISVMGFVLAGLAMLFLLHAAGKERRVSAPGVCLSFALFLMSCVILVGYLYERPFLYGATIIPVAFPAAGAFLFLSAGLIAAAGPDSFLLRFFVGPSARARLLRAFLPMTVIMALADGFLHHELPLHLHLSLALISVVAVGLIIAQTARTLGDAMDKAEAERKRAEDTRDALLHDLAETLKALHASEAILQKQSQELVRSNTDLEQFAYVASHDLQEPLRMITSFLQLLNRKYKDHLDAKAHEYIAYAVDGAVRMQGLIHDLLAYCRVGAQGNPMQPTSVDTLLREVLADLQLLIDETNAVITCDALPTVPADGSQLRLLLQNLISNAIKFRSTQPPCVHLSATMVAGEWRFSVQDNGIGIAEKHIERIFVIFQRLHAKSEYSGTGIGLAVCKRVVERHGGRIWVESKPDSGSTFFFTLPQTV